MLMSSKSLMLAGLIALAAPAVQASTVTFETIADGRVKTANGAVAETGDAVISFANEADWAAIFEFNLSSLADDVTITGARFEYTITNPTAGKFGSGSSTVNLSTFLGDGEVTAADHGAAGAQVYSGSLAWGGTAGDVISYTLSDLTDVRAALQNDLLTIRNKAGLFSHIYVASLENATHSAARLIIDYEEGAPVSAVPLPGTLPLSAAAMLGFVALTRRRRSRHAAR